MKLDTGAQCNVMPLHANLQGVDKGQAHKVGYEACVILGTQNENDPKEHFRGSVQGEVTSCRISRVSVEPEIYCIGQE